MGSLVDIARVAWFFFFVLGGIAIWYSVREHDSRGVELSDGLVDTFFALPWWGKASWALLLITAVIPAIEVIYEGGIRDEEGFGPESFQIYPAEASEFPLYDSPGEERSVLRYAEQFETYVLGEKQGGFVRIRLDRDNLIGWARIADADPASAPGFVGDLLDVLSTSWSLFWSNYSFVTLALDIVLGIVITAVLLRVFGYRRGELIDRRLTVLVLIVTAVSIFAANRVFSPDPIQRARMSSAMISVFAVAAFPTLLGAGVGELVYSEEKIEGIGAIVVGFFVSFTFWLVHGKVAGIV